ncbi:MAG TPA: M50 family metallopeptidase, partial [Acidimicrobiales bacterium]|nr:M50 family metallopeptidase [Acidimicrobiales bacterium]
ESSSLTQTSPTLAPETVIPDPDVHRAERRKLLLLAAIFVGVIGISIMNGSFPVVAFVIAMAATVMLHEAGHFVVAKRSGMKCTEFFLGFGPRLWSVRKGETEYGIKALPFGGYVKILGMTNLEADIDPEDEPRTYRQQSYPKRMAVALAGIVTHFAMAFLLLIMIFAAIGIPGYDKRPVIGSISKLDSGPSPAQTAGFKVGDRIVSIDGNHITRWEDIPPHTQGSAGRELAFVVNRNGTLVDLTATPAAVTSGGETRGVIGIEPKPDVERMNPLAAVPRSGSQIWHLSTSSVAGMGSAFSPSSLKNYAGDLTNSTKKSSSSTSTDDQRFVSVVGVARIAGQAAHSGAFNVVYLLVLLNIFIGVFNLVPLLPLDGGHVAIATYERIRSRAGRRYQADVGKMMPVAAAMIVILVLIGVTSIYLDIVRPMANPFQ